MALDEDRPAARAGTMDRWVENLLRPMLIAGMMACIAAPPLLFLEWLLPGWEGTYVLYFIFFAGLEGVLAERILRKQRISGWVYLASRAGELLLLLLVLKVVNYVPQGLDQLVADARAWPADPGLFVTDLDLLTGLLFVPLWWGALYVGHMTAELDLEAGRMTPPPDRTSIKYYLWLTQPAVARDRQERLEWLGELFLWGGIVLLLAGTLVHIFISSAQALAAPILLYFALGIALLSQAQFSVSHASWQTQGIPVQSGIGRRWLLWVLIFLVGIALVALIVPTGYEMGPLRAVWGAINLVLQLILTVFTVIYVLLVLLLGLLFPNLQLPERPEVPSQLFPGVQPGAEAHSIPWLEILLSAAFWIVILVIVVYALIRFVRERFGWREADGPAGPWLARFLAWLRALWRRWRGWREQALARWVQRRAAAGEDLPADRLVRFLSLRSLSPRDLVRYFYVSAARRAAQAGRPRRPGETPYEYQSTLGAQFPDLEPDLTGLTEAFVEARYSRRHVEQAKAEMVKRLWQRIKAALRARRIRA